MNLQVDNKLATGLDLFSSRWFEGENVKQVIEKILQLVLIYLQVENSMLIISQKGRIGRCQS
mgnify:CR=1 FL=1